MVLFRSILICRKKQVCLKRTLQWLLNDAKKEDRTAGNVSRRVQELWYRTSAQWAVDGLDAKEDAFTFDTFQALLRELDMRGKK